MFTSIFERYLKWLVKAEDGLSKLVFLFWIFIAVIAAGSVAMAASNQALVYQGRIIRPDGTPVDSGTVVFTLAVYSPIPGHCLLYSETQTVNMAGSLGMFSLPLGAGARTDGGSHSFNDVFVNGKTLSGLTCDSGTSFTGAVAEDREMRVSFNDAGTIVNLSSMAIKSVPFALQAHEVDGWGLNNLVKVSSVGSPTTFTTAEMANAKLLTAPGPCATNEILKWNGSAWSCASDATGGTPSDAAYTGTKGIVAFDTDAATSGITVTSGIAKLSNTGVTAATYGTASKISSFTVNAQGRITSASEIAISIPSTQITGGSASTGDVLKWNGSAWLPATDLTGTSPGDASYAAKGLVQGDTDAATSGLNLSSGVISVNSGTAANQIVKLDASAKLPAVDGSQLTNLSISQLSAGTLAVSKGGTGSAAALSNNKVMVSSGGAIVEGNGFGSSKAANTFITRDASGNFAAGVGTLDSLKLNGSTSGTLTITAPSNFTNYSLNFPSADGSAGQFLKTDGSGNLSWASASTAAITSLNGLTAATQTFVIGTSGNSPNFSSATATHTLNIPMASNASVTAGLISKTDYDIFYNKLGTSQSFSGDVSGNYNATSVDKIKAAPVSISSLSSGNYLKYNGSAWVNASLGSSDITGALGYTPVNKAGDTMSGSLDLAGKNITNVGTLALKGSTSGTLSMTVPATVTSYTLNWPAADGSSGQFLKTDGAGNLSWATSATPGDATYAAKGIVQFNTDAATSGISLSGGVATVNYGTGANQIVKLDAASKLPAVDGSALTNLNANNISSGTLPISKGGTGASTKTSAFDALSPTSAKGDITVHNGTNNISLPRGSDGQVLTTDSAQASGLKWANPTTGTVTSVTGGTGLTGGTITSVGTLNVDVGTGANQIVQMTATSKLPAVDGSALTNLSADNIASGTLPVSRGGTGVGSFAANNLVGTNGTGTALQAVTCAQNQVLSFDATGKYGCYNLSSLASGTYFANGGNSFAGAATLGTNDNNTLALKTNNVVALTIDTAGKIGVGTSSPTGIIHTASETNAKIYIDNYGTASNPAVVGRMARGTAAAPSPILQDDDLLYFGGRGYGVTDFSATSVAGIGIIAAENFTDSNQGAYLIFETTPLGSTVRTERMRIGANGNVGIGTFNPGAPLDVNGEIRMSGTTSGYAGLKSPAVGPSVTWTLPPADGSAGQFLKTDGAGNLSWATSATPGNATYAAKGIVQFNTDAATSGVSLASGVATVNFGTGANQIVKLDSSSKLPAVDGSALINLNANNLTSGTLPISRGGTGASTKTSAFDSLSPNTTKGDLIVSDGTNNIRLPRGSDGQVLIADSVQSAGVKWATAAAGTVTSVTAGTGLNGGTITNTGTLSVNVGTGASQIVQLTASSKLPAVDGSALTNLSATQISSGTLPVARGGTGASSFAANNLVGINGTGTAQQAVTCSQNQLLSFDASGNYGCYTLSSLASGTYFAKGGNSFGGAANLGTNDANTLALKTNGTVAMTIDTAGKVGIGTPTPGSILDVTGSSTSAILNVANQASATYVPLISAYAPNMAGTQNANISFGKSATSWNSGALTFVYDGNGAATNRLEFSLYNTSSLLAVRADGNIGIGTISPNGKFGVNQTTAGSAALEAENGGTVFWKILNPAGGATNSWNAANAIQYVGKDAGTNRSINAAGTVNSNGADFAEWVDWRGPKPPMGSVVRYKGSFVVISSPSTAAFIGNDAREPNDSVLVAFAGQLPVLVRGIVHEGDLIVAAGDGTGRAVPKIKATLTEAQKAVGTAWESSDDPGLKRVRVAVGIGLVAGQSDIDSLRAESAAKDQRIRKMEKDLKLVTQQNAMMKAYLCLKDPKVPFCNL